MTNLPDLSTNNTIIVSLTPYYIPILTHYISVGLKAWILTIHGWNCAKRGSMLRATIHGLSAHSVDRADRRAQSVDSGNPWIELNVAWSRAIRESNCTSVKRTGQRTPPTVCCWTSPSPSLWPCHILKLYTLMHSNVIFLCKGMGICMRTGQLHVS